MRVIYLVTNVFLFHFEKKYSKIYLKVICRLVYYPKNKQKSVFRQIIGIIYLTLEKNGLFMLLRMCKSFLVTISIKITLIIKFFRCGKL